MQSNKPVEPEAPGPRRFMTTHWSVVLDAARSSATGHHQALDTLCRTYWFPLYAFLRRRGCDPEEAADLTQAFFAKILEKGYLKSVTPKPGKFRAFLLTALKNFVANERKAARAIKRGGGKTVLSLDFDDAESRYSLEPADRISPERLYERSWALTVINTAMKQLEAELAEKGRQNLLDHLAEHLTADAEAVPYAEIAEKLDMNPAAVRVTVHRLRKRCRQLIREQITQTVTRPEDIDDEIRTLFSALGG